MVGRKKVSNRQASLILGVVLVLAAGVLLIKQFTSDSTRTAMQHGEPPAVTLERALEAHQPTLAFFHSTTCDLCLEMMHTVAEVHPEFGDTVVLVDVDVYDKANASLLNQVRLQYIPTLVFIDRQGQGEIVVGTMDAERLRHALMTLAEGG